MPVVQLHSTMIQVVLLVQAECTIKTIWTMVACRTVELMIKDKDMRWHRPDPPLMANKTRTILVADKVSLLGILQGRECHLFSLKIQPILHSIQDRVCLLLLLGILSIKTTVLG